MRIAISSIQPGAESDSLLLGFIGTIPFRPTAETYKKMLEKIDEIWEEFKQTRLDTDSEFIAFLVDYKLPDGIGFAFLFGSPMEHHRVHW